MSRVTRAVRKQRRNSPVDDRRRCKKPTIEMEKSPSKTGYYHGRMTTAADSHVGYDTSLRSLLCLTSTSVPTLMSARLTLDGRQRASVLPMPGIAVSLDSDISSVAF